MDSIDIVVCVFYLWSRSMYKLGPGVLASFDVLEPGGEFPTHCLLFAGEKLCNMPRALLIFAPCNINRECSFPIR